LRVPIYVKNLETGIYNPRPEIRVICETAAAFFVDADRALGPVASVPTTKRIIAKAREAGICWGMVRNSGHQGAIGYYAQQIAQEGLAAMTWTCNPPNMAPFGARAAGVHNSPIAMAVPRKGHRPLLLDMATSVVAGGKLELAADKGVSIPLGWALDANGNPTTDPKQGKVLLPAAGYKGYGLALMFECLSSVMMGNPLLLPKLLNRQPAPPMGTQNCVIAAINIGLFTDLAGYEQNIDDLGGAIKALPKADGFDEIMLPGELEDRTYDERVAKGIPLPEGTIRRLRETAERFGVKLPEGM
jgi:ureidoglycolate dehydrogenase (NAD+)